MKTKYVEELMITLFGGTEVIVLFPFGNFLSDGIFDRKIASFHNSFVGIYNTSSPRHFIVDFSKAGSLGREIISTLEIVEKKLSEQERYLLLSGLMITGFDKVRTELISKFRSFGSYTKALKFLLDQKLAYN